MTPIARHGLLAGLLLFGVAATSTALAPRSGAEEAKKPLDEKLWIAVAPGRVEPVSGEIRIGAPLIARIGELPVKPNDTVFSGEVLMRLVDDELRARVAIAEAQVAFRRRVRNDTTVTGRALDRRRAEDAVYDAERELVTARAALDTAAAARRASNGPESELEAARAAFTRAQERLRQTRADLRRIESDTTAPLPSQVEGQLNIARAELLAAEAAVEKLVVRAPIGGTVLQVNARAGELASPAGAVPLVLLGDLSTLRVRVELEERDVADIKIGQAVDVRASAFGARTFAGKVAVISPVVEQGRIGVRGNRTVTDVDVVEVLIDLNEPGPLLVGMKADVYFRR